MNIEQLAETLPEWAKDLRLNLLAAPKTEGSEHAAGVGHHLGGRSKYPQPCAHSGG